MVFRVKVSGKVAGKLFAGALWKLEDKTLEVIVAHEDGTIECETESGDPTTMQANEFVKWTFLGDKYAAYDKEPDEVD